MFRVTKFDIEAKALDNTRAPKHIIIEGATDLNPAGEYSTRYFPSTNALDPAVALSHPTSPQIPDHDAI